MRALHLLLVFLAGLNVVQNTTAQAGSLESGRFIQRKTLRGLDGVRVVVEVPSPAVLHAGLTQGQVQAAVEHRLRRAGIGVLSQEDWRQTPGTPWLYVRVSGVRAERGAYAYAVDITLKQEVIPTRDPYIEQPLVDAATWDTGRVGYTGTAGLQPIWDDIGHCLTTFINDYGSMNPASFKPAQSHIPN